MAPFVNGWRPGVTAPFPMVTILESQLRNLNYLSDNGYYEEKEQHGPLHRDTMYPEPCPGIQNPGWYPEPVRKVSRTRGTSKEVSRTQRTEYREPVGCNNKRYAPYSTLWLVQHRGYPEPDRKGYPEPVRREAGAPLGTKPRCSYIGIDEKPCFWQHPKKRKKSS